jgi:hypothetical protein
MARAIDGVIVRSFSPGIQNGGAVLGLAKSTLLPITIAAGK